MVDSSVLLSFRDHLRLCTACELRQAGGPPVPWSGDVNPAYAVLGEAPGRSEAAAGEPFIGPAGQKLRYIMKKVGMDPIKMAFLNSAACYPGDIKTPNANHLAACRPWLHGQLEFIRPKVLITTGVVAFNAIWEGKQWPSLAQVHGKPLHHPLHNFKVWSTYHPAAILRGSKKYEKVIAEDLEALVNWDGYALDKCYIGTCESELDGWDGDGRGIGLCERHSLRAGTLFP